MSWYLDVLKKYAVFTGRARRKEYWMFFLFSVLVGFAIGLVAGLLGKVLGAAFSSIIAVVYWMAILVPSIAVAVRRMHDTGRSGWWLFVPVLSLIYVCTDSQPGPNEYGPNPKMA